MFLRPLLLVIFLFTQIHNVSYLPTPDFSSGQADEHLDPICFAGFDCIVDALHLLTS